ncbi:MAG: hypothetical protein QOG66_3327 [Methylobacteriaceae bacterium]|nr:hypothetical protein [Methylobacteriaceae bacterium]
MEFKINTCFDERRWHRTSKTVLCLHRERRLCSLAGEAENLPRAAGTLTPKHGLLRILNESGDDYLHPKVLFRLIALPRPSGKPCWRRLRAPCEVAQRRSNPGAAPACDCFASLAMMKLRQLCINPQTMRSVHAHARSRARRAVLPPRPCAHNGRHRARPGPALRRDACVRRCGRVSAGLLPAPRA